jgi:putative peptide zinc metalloprotease protein
MNQPKPPSNANEAAEQQAARHAAQAPVVEVPEYPALAPDVELVGEMKESGFEDRQWLIQRGGRFIQLTELLYRVVEQSNGERTLAEIATEVTRASDWMVSADNVRLLIQSKLLPLGIIAPADGTPPAGSHVGPGVEGPTRSPLRVNMRQRLIGPRFIDPFTRVLQALFAPVAVIPFLAAIVVAHGWLYLMHGVGRGLREVILQPSLALAVLAIVFASGIFHEFGHAAALRYGGGRTRGMGFGLYLVYPALYTDTTDSYRLGRWGKVRTDLGGFYFHLIFALGLVVLSLLTGWEFLLVAVLLINLDILYQCLPFVRFDGYWALADLTGIPDFFSQMGAFLRSWLPISRWRGAKLPKLKPWAKAIFISYVIVTVPVLSLLLFFLVTHLPGVVSTFRESLLIQAGAFSSALDSGDPFEAALSIAQILMLGLQALAITYLLYILSRMLIVAVLTQFIYPLVRRTA